ncbi:MAG: hypothetical protein AAFW76_10915, partial [Pseudomonadota bacterium]
PSINGLFRRVTRLICLTPLQRASGHIGTASLTGTTARMLRHQMLRPNRGIAEHNLGGEAARFKFNVPSGDCLLTRIDSLSIALVVRAFLARQPDIPHRRPVA